MVATPQGGAILAGYTQSSENIASNDGFQPTFAGASDAYMARFDTMGKRLWGTYYGGSAEEYKVGAATDSLGNVYLRASTGSAAGIVSPDAYQGTFGGGYDIALAKFDAGGQRLWSTYYGGSSGETDWGVGIFSPGAVYIAGKTHSTDNIASPGAFDTMKEEPNPDGFLVRLSEETGQLCAGPEACSQGFCVDGVCCDSACGGGVDDCQVCAAAMGALTDGTCTKLGADVLCRPGTGPDRQHERRSAGHQQRGAARAHRRRADDRQCDGQQRRRRQRWHRHERRGRRRYGMRVPGHRTRGCTREPASARAPTPPSARGCNAMIRLPPKKMGHISYAPTGPRTSPPSTLARAAARGRATLSGDLDVSRPGGSTNLASSGNVATMTGPSTYCLHANQDTLGLRGSIHTETTCNPPPPPRRPGWSEVLTGVAVGGAMFGSVVGLWMTLRVKRR